MHRLLEHPDQEQNDMQTECQLVSHGSGYGDSNARLLEAGAKDWELLLQIHSDPNAGMEWGDIGKIYYWIPRQALDEKKFEQTWMIMQCG